jgi:hypothetical protein
MTVSHGYLIFLLCVAIKSYRREHSLIDMLFYIFSEVISGVEGGVEESCIALEYAPGKMCLPEMLPHAPHGVALQRAG